MTTRPASALSDTHMGRPVTATGRLIALMGTPGAKTYDLTIRVPADQVVEIHRDA